jgi:hypothetical protein
VNGSMRPHHENDRQVDEQARSALGVAPRCAGVAIARERAAAYQGFTPAVPHAAAIRRVLEEGGRQLGLRAGVVRTLGTLLTLYRGWGLRRPPVLTASNAAIAHLVACDERTVQKHLAALREQGLILVEYGPYNRRRPDEEARPDDLTGIDLRPAIVVALELQARLALLAKQRQAVTLSLRRAQRALLLARAALAARPEPDPSALKMLEAHRRTLRRLRRQLMHPATSPAELRPIQAAIEELARTLEEATVGEGRVEKTTDPSPRDVVSAIHKTETNSVDESDGFKAARSDDEEPGQRRLSLDETTEREIEARQQAHRLGLATRYLNQAIERHGTSPVVQAVAHVWQQREKGRVRNPGGLLATLLRRPEGRLTPQSLHAARPWRLPLAAEEARAMAAELAPSHNPHWLWQRFEGYRRQCGAELHDERRAFAGFARKCQRDQAQRGSWN